MPSPPYRISVLAFLKPPPILPLPHLSSNKPVIKPLPLRWPKSIHTIACLSGLHTWYPPKPHSLEGVRLTGEWETQAPRFTLPSWLSSIKLLIPLRYILTIPCMPTWVLIGFCNNSLLTSLISMISCGGEAQWTSLPLSIHSLPTTLHLRFTWWRYSVNNCGSLHHWRSLPHPLHPAITQNDWLTKPLGSQHAIGPSSSWNVYKVRSLDSLCISQR